MTEPSSAPTDSPVNPGDILADKFRVDRVLGLGGMGVVVAATHLQLQQRVALKFMLEEGLANPELVERFSREARAAVRLRSDHVARVLDVGTLSTGSPYIVMEYLEGSDLGSVLERRGSLPIEEAVDYVLQACDAVAEAHALGIIHRDLKPRNLFLTTRNDGRALVKVLDFGISKQRAAEDVSLTRTTQIMGSPYYMSPEQFRSAKAVDDRSDVWALGAILYEMIAGQVPFMADSVTALTALVLMEPHRPLASLRPNVPAKLVSAIERCLQKDPANRFQSVAQLAIALQPFAPLDSRELANRIARIGAGAQVSFVESAPDGVGPHSLTGGTWTAPAVSRSRSKAIVGLGATVVGVGAIGAIGFALARGSSGSPAATSPSQTPSAPASAVPSTPVAPVVLAPEPAVIAAPGAVDAGPAIPPPSPAQAAAPNVRPASAPKTPHGPPNGPNASPSDDPAKYRTTW